MRIKICQPTTHDASVEKIRKAVEEVVDPGTEFDVINVKKGPESLESNYDEAWATLFQLNLLEKAEEEGYDAAVSYCFGDPALKAAKEKLTIPVVGIHEPAIHLACMLGRKFSIIGIGGCGGRGYLEDLVKEYGLEHRLASVRSLDMNRAHSRDRSRQVCGQTGRRPC